MCGDTGEKNLFHVITPEHENRGKKKAKQSREKKNKEKRNQRVMRSNPQFPFEEKKKKPEVRAAGLLMK